MTDEADMSKELKEGNMDEKEDAEKGEEQQLDEDGNPINPEDLLPKEPQNPLKRELIQKSLSKLAKTYGLLY
jgi:hypothetical protein